MYPYVPVIGFPRMAGLILEEYAADTGVAAVGIDTAVDIGRAAAMLPKTVAVQGNLDPLVLVAGGESMRNDARAVLDAMRDRPFIFNLGHGIVPQTSPEHVGELIELIRAS